MTEATQTLADREIVQERVFDAPRALVYKAWTDPQHLPHWMGPKGFSCSTHAIDLREGGAWHFTMHGPDGKDWPNFMKIVEMRAPERIVYDHGADPDGAPHFRVTVTFEDRGVKTFMRMVSLFPTAAAAEAVKGFGAVELGQQTLDKLGERVASMGLRITRTLDAPRDLVYKAWTEPERLAKWWGPAGMELEVKALDVRAGGWFHYRMFTAQGAEMWGKFRYLEATAPERLVYVSSFSDAEGNTTRAPFAQEFPLEIYNIVTFTEQGGKTVLELGGGPLDASPEELKFYQGMNASMQQGFGATFQQLVAYLASVQ